MNLRFCIDAVKPRPDLHATTSSTTAGTHLNAQRSASPWYVNFEHLRPHSAKRYPQARRRCGQWSSSLWA
jgi:hypothetical protein